MKEMLFGCLLFFCGLLGLLLFPITATQGPWAISADLLNTSMLTFAVMLIIGAVICIYEAYMRK